jgi:phenylpyruvate tautomerase PptA (4-oxalocrotonate tautomerase family)
MPLIRVDTNVRIDEAAQDALLKDLSRLAAEDLGKPERYVMVHLHAGQPMALAGSTEPLANVEVRSIGLEAADTAELSASLCRFLEQRLGLAPARIYLQFVPFSPAFWGWDGATF